MRPYYEEGGITIYHGDCREVTAWLEADVLITDPPYGTRFSAENPQGGYGRRQNAGHGPSGFVIDGDDTTATRDAALALWASRGPALVFGSPRMSDPPGAWTDRLVWDKQRPGMNGGPWRYRHESIYATRGFIRVSDSDASILTYFPERESHIHAKPVALMVRLVKCAPAGIIADPFAGMGATLVAAKLEGRHAIGIEIEERYCEIAAKRLAQGVLPFGGPA